MSFYFFASYLVSALFYVVLWWLIRKGLRPVPRFPARIWLWASVVFPMLALVYYLVFGFLLGGTRIFGSDWAFQLVSLGLTVLGYGLTIFAFVSLIRWIRENLSTVAPMCPVCDHNLTGLEKPRCPECGTQFEIETRYLTRAVAS